MKFVHLAAVGFSLTFVVNSFSADPTFDYIIRRGTFGTVEDATVSVDPRLAGRNLGAEPTIGVWQHGGIALLKFDLSALPKHASVQKCQLQLFSLSAGFANEEIQRSWELSLRPLRLRWKEGMGTSQRHDADGVSSFGPSYEESWPDEQIVKALGDSIGRANHRGEEQRFYQWDIVPDFASSWHADESMNFGLAVTGRPPGKAVSFAASDYEELAKRPQLKLTVSIPVQRLLEDAVGVTDARLNSRGVIEIDTPIVPLDGRITVNLDWEVERSSTRSEFSRSVRSDVKRILEAMDQLGPALHHVSIRGFAPLEDTFGAGPLVPIVNASYNRVTIEKIQWDSFRSEAVFAIADSAVVHPFLR